MFLNTYEDTTRAEAYDELGLGGTYHLIFRDLPTILKDSVRGTRAVDFGCGTGRTARFLTGLNFRTVGLDISPQMVAVARDRDPGGDYRVIEDGDFSSLLQFGNDLVLSAFTFDNIPGHERKVRLFSGLRRLLHSGGRLVNIVSTPEIYTHEWTSFSTLAYPENTEAGSGDVVRIITTDYSDNRPVDDILWPDEAYRAVYQEAGLEVVSIDRPLGRGDEGIRWVSETEVAPWAIYVLKPVTLARG